MAKPKPPTEAELLFEDSIHRALSIPPDEARAIIERTAPSRRAKDRGPLKTPPKPRPK